MKYAIIGAGGTGGCLGFFLKKAGKDVTLIARGKHLEAIRKNGLTIQKLWDESRETLPVKACTAEEYKEIPDVILVCIKGYSMDETVPTIKKIAGKETVVIPILNIYGTGGRLQKKLPELTVTDGCIYVSANIMEPGVILQHGKILRVVFGARKPEEETEKMREVAKDMVTDDLEVIDRLKKEYPDAGCTLDYDQAWKLLVSVRLAAQCTDARVNVVVEDLYAKYPDVASLAAAEPEEIEAIVRPCGLGKSKARDISACMRILHEQYADNVPTTFEELLKLPGVGRKSANLIMGDVFGKPAIVTDTHCIRLCNRIGLVDGIKEPKKVEMALWKIIPPEEGSDFCHRLVYHGREVCTARTKPYCDRCCLADICAKNI